MHIPQNAATLYTSHKHRLLFDIVELDELVGDIPHNTLIGVSAQNAQDITRISSSIIALRLTTTANDIAVLDCANNFDVRALKRKLDNQSNDVVPLLSRIKISRAFTLAEAREGIDHFKNSTGDDDRQLVIINGISRLVSASNATQGQAIVDAMLKSAQQLSSHNTTVIIADGFVSGTDLDDADCSMEGAERQRPFLHAATATILDIHLHIHTISETSIVEIAADRYNGNFSACTELKTRP